MPHFLSACDHLPITFHLPFDLFPLLYRPFAIVLWSSKEAGNRLQDITERLPQDAQVALSQRGWSLYVMNMVYQSGNQLIFRKDNEKEYQPYFGSTAKAQLRGTTLPEMSADAFDALCRRLALPLLLEKIARLPDLTVR